MSKTKRIKIIGCSGATYWYKDAVSLEFDVLDETTDSYWVQTTELGSYAVAKSDAELISDVVEKGMKNIYDLNLHEHTQVADLLYATRVPGGWIYESFNEGGDVAAPVFVPWNTEFKPKPTRSGFDEQKLEAYLPPKIVEGK